MEKYIVQKSETTAGGWVCTDTEHGVVMSWTEGDFSQSQRITFLEDVPRATALNVATILREMGDYLAEYHRDKVGNKNARPAWRGVIDAVKKIRKDRGLTQQDVATALGCSKQNYQRFEAGKECPSLRMLAEVCDVLGLTLHVTGDEQNWGK